MLCSTVQRQVLQWVCHWSQCLRSLLLQTWIDQRNWLWDYSCLYSRKTTPSTENLFQSIRSRNRSLGSTLGTLGHHLQCLVFVCKAVSFHGLGWDYLLDGRDCNDCSPGTRLWGKEITGITTSDRTLNLRVHTYVGIDSNTRSLEFPSLQSSSRSFRKTHPSI